jgi:tetratricopeptide (TPR) repeat protein
MKKRSTARGAAHAGSPAEQRPAPRAARAAVAVRLAAVAAVAVAVLVYLPALGNGFIWDDPLVLAQLRAMHSWGDLIVMPPQVPRYYYRPVIFISYLIDRALGGEAPFWFHLSVIALHALNCLLVFRLAAYVFGQDVALAAAGAVLFAVLPTHVESVAWMAGRSDVIVCTFLLLTVLLAVRRESPWTAWAGGVTFLLALLSKEMAISGLLIVPALDWLSTRRLYWRRYTPLLVATVAYFALRQRSVGALVGGAPVPIAGDVVLDLLRALGYYFVRTFAPVGLSPYVPTVPDSPVFLLAGVLAPLAAAGLIYRTWPQARWPLAFLLLWFALTLAPSLTVIIRRSASAPVADRYLYVPSVATCLLAAWGVFALARWKGLTSRWPLGILAALSAVLAIAAASYARVWTDNLTFWSDVASKTPQDALVQRELATALLERGRLDDAERALQQALALPGDPEGRVMAYSNLGVIYRRQARFADSIAAFESALQLTRHPALYHNLGMTLMAKGEHDQRQGDTTAVLAGVRQARNALETALTLEDPPGPQSFLADWDPAKTHALLGQVLNSLGDRGGARQHLQTALRLQPTGPVADVTRRYLERIPP